MESQEKSPVAAEREKRAVDRQKVLELTDLDPQKLEVNDLEARLTVMKEFYNEVKKVWMWDREKPEVKERYLLFLEASLEQSYLPRIQEMIFADDERKETSWNLNDLYWLFRELKKERGEKKEEPEFLSRYYFSVPRGVNSIKFLEDEDRKQAANGLARLHFTTNVSSTGRHISADYLAKGQGNAVLQAFAENHSATLAAREKGGKHNLFVRDGHEAIIVGRSGKNIRELAAVAGLDPRDVRVHGVAPVTENCFLFRDNQTTPDMSRIQYISVGVYKVEDRPVAYNLTPLAEPVPASEMKGFYYSISIGAFADLLENDQAAIDKNERLSKIQLSLMQMAEQEEFLPALRRMLLAQKELPMKG